MDTHEHLARAREYIVIAESTDAKREAYIKAAEEITASGYGNRAAARELGKSEAWVRQLVDWATNAQDHAHLPFGGPANTERSHRSVTKRFLERAAGQGTEAVERIIEELPAEAVQRVAAASAKVSREKAERRDREAGTKHRGGDDLEKMSRWQGTRHRVRVDLRALAADGVSEAAREVILEEIELIEQALGWARSYLESGARGFEAQLEELLG